MRKDGRDDYMREYRKNNYARIKEYAVNYYKENKNDYLMKCKSYTFKLKKLVIQKLGEKCVGCHTQDIRVLQVNHRNGGGSKERKNRHSRNFYAMILSGERPIKDLELRCANCNLIYEYENKRRFMPPK